MNHIKNNNIIFNIYSYLKCLILRINLGNFYLEIKKQFDQCKLMCASFGVFYSFRVRCLLR